MKGKVINQTPINDSMDRLLIEEIETKKLIDCTLDHLDKNYVGKNVSIYTSVTEIANADFGHVYPQGTIGTF